MSDTVKLIIEIPEERYERIIKDAQARIYTTSDLFELIDILKNGTPLDDVKAEIEQTAKDYDKFADHRRVRGLWIALKILDRIGKESEVKE